MNRRIEKLMDEKWDSYCLNTKKINYLIKLCDYEIKENREVIKEAETKEEKSAWREENKFLKEIIKSLREVKKPNTQLVIQGLTAEQEDYLLESQLEQIREAKEKC